MSSCLAQKNEITSKRARDEQEGEADLAFRFLFASSSRNLVVFLAIASVMSSRLAQKKETTSERERDSEGGRGHLVFWICFASSSRSRMAFLARASANCRLNQNAPPPPPPKGAKQNTKQVSKTETPPNTGRTQNTIHTHTHTHTIARNIHTCTSPCPSGSSKIFFSLRSKEKKNRRGAMFDGEIKLCLSTSRELPQKEQDIQTTALHRGFKLKRLHLSLLRRKLQTCFKTAICFIFKL